MKAIIYVRVSTQEQQAEGVSLAMQRDRAKAWAVGSGYEVGEMFCETMSAARASNRPELQKALDAVCTSRGVLVVYSLSRLARSVRDTLEIAERLEKAGANLASLTERVDTNSAVGKMVFRVMAAIHEFEKDQLVERTVGAMAHLRKNNRRISGNIPYGSYLAHDGTTLVPHETEQAVLTRIAGWRSEAASLETIARRLNVERVPTRKGGQWYSSTVWNILDRKRKLAAA